MGRSTFRERQSLPNSASFPETYTYLLTQALQTQSFDLSRVLKLGQRTANSGGRRRDSTSHKIKLQAELRHQVSYTAVMVRLLITGVLWLAFLSSTVFSKSYDRFSFQAGKIMNNWLECFVPEGEVNTFTQQGYNTVSLGSHFDDHLYSETALPSLNLFDYDHSEFPVFPEFHFPFGFSRKDMPQLDYNKTTPMWERFRDSIRRKGGSITLHKSFDLRQARPLQREVSGHIVHNVILDNLKEQLSVSSRRREASSSVRNFFTKSILLVKSPSSVRSNSGGVIDKDSFFILDGHHTTYAAASLCAMWPHTLLRLGNFNSMQSSCGELFDPKQDIFVIEGVEVFDVRKIALDSGATTGHGMTIEQHP